MYAASAVKVSVVGWKVIEGGKRGCRRVVALAHGVHGNITAEGRLEILVFIKVRRKMETLETYRNVPPENSSNTPVHHLIDCSSPEPPPNVLTTTHVPTAPIGAARLNAIRCALAPLFPRPCFSSTAVSPKAAGALCTMIATKMINESEVVDEEEDDAPKAIPSAVACMQRPSVVDRARWGGGGVGEVDRSERE